MLDSSRLLVANIVWLDAYRGDPSDRPQAAGKFKKHWAGHERYNFAPVDGRMYGYFPTTRDANRINFGPPFGVSNNLQSIDGVTVVWIATHPRRGRRVVGWYLNATLHARHQDWSGSPVRPHPTDSTQCGFRAEARESDAILLADSERTFVPRDCSRYHTYGGTLSPDERARLIDYVERVTAERRSAREAVARRHQPSIEKRIAVERGAVNEAVRYYTECGYDVRSVESERVGWDLEVAKGAERLLVEVKGTSGPSPAAELTPNEYTQMLTRRDEYRVCIVTQADATPRLFEFSFHADVDEWRSGGGRVLTITERVSAVLAGS